VPTDTPPERLPNHGRNFALRGAAWSLGLFGLVRLSWFEAAAVLPLTRVQAHIAELTFGPAVRPIDITLACSGADALALCAGAILAYPAAWRTRVAGAAGGVALILAINTVRIGTLGRVADSPGLFDALHVYGWPAVLTLAIAGYVFTWMQVVERRAERAKRSSSGPVPCEQPAPAATISRRFVVWTTVLLVLFTAASPLYLESGRVLAVAALIARIAASLLASAGLQASATGNMLSTARGQFLVTQECISTPLIPVYLAAVFAYSRSWRRRAIGIFAAVPLFVSLGIARLLVVALPPTLVASPLFLVHAFYQLLLAVVVVFLAAMWRHGASALAWRRALLGGALGLAVVYVLGAPYTRALVATFGSTTFDDPQGAIALLPAFQVGLYVALAAAAFTALTWQLFATGLSLLVLSQAAVFAALPFVLRHAGVMPHVRDIRAWALAGPILTLVAMMAYERPDR
jgi:exosortase/archaeosortase family protein